MKCVGDSLGYIVKEIHKQSAQGAPCFLAAYRKMQKDSHKNLFPPIKENVFDDFENSQPLGSKAIEMKTELQKYHTQ